MSGQRKDQLADLSNMFGRLRTEVPWHDLTECYEPWQTMFDWFNCYRKEGTLDRLLRTLQRHL